MSSFVAAHFYGPSYKRFKHSKESYLKKESELKQNKLIKPYKPKFTDKVLNHSWKVFRCQKDLLHYQTANKNVKAFSYESDMFIENVGQRLFLATNYEEFWHIYKQLEPNKRIHYEIIPEGKPCHLYFDVEFDYDLNDNRDGKFMMLVFLKFIVHCMKKFLQLEISLKDFLILKSKSKLKFSRHIIIHMPGDVVFIDNYHAGLFVKHICRYYNHRCKIRNKKFPQQNIPGDNGERKCNTNADHHKENCHVTGQYDDGNGDDGNGDDDNVEDSDDDDLFNGQLLIKNRSNQEQIFCDLGVYSKNRNFRLYLSNKRGKCNAFMLDEEMTCYLSTVETCSKTKTKDSYHDCQQIPSINSMTSTLSSVSETPGSTLSTVTTSCEIVDKSNEQHHKNVFYKSLICNIQINSETTAVYFDGNKFILSNIHKLQELHRETSSGASSFKLNVQTTTAKNLFQLHNNVDNKSDVDIFVESLIQTGGMSGKIWRKMLNKQCCLLLYDIVNNRFCRNINRFHKSNNVRIVVDTIKYTWYQTCHDPDCRFFKSTELPLPCDVKLVGEECCQNIDDKPQVCWKTKSNTDSMSDLLNDSFDDIISNFNEDSINEISTSKNVVHNSVMSESIVNDLATFDNTSATSSQQQNNQMNFDDDDDELLYSSVSTFECSLSLINDDDDDWDCDG